MNSSLAVLADTLQMRDEADLAQWLDRARVVASIKDRGGRYLYVNESMQRLTGMGLAEVLGKSDFEIFPESVARSCQVDDEFVVRDGRAVEWEEYLENGEFKRTFTGIKFPLLDQNRKVWAVCLIATDICARKKNEKILLDTAVATSNIWGEGVFQSLLIEIAKALDVRYALIALTPNGREAEAHTLAYYANGKIIDNISYSLKGTPCYEVLGERFGFWSENVLWNFDDENAKALNLEAYAGMPLYDTQGECVGLVAVFDTQPFQNLKLFESVLRFGSERISVELQRCQAEEAKRASQATYRAMVNAALDCIVTVDRVGRIVEFNPAAEQTFGYRREQVLGQPLAELIIPKRLRHRHNLGLAQFQPHRESALIGKRVELTAMRADGSEFPIEAVIESAQLNNDYVFIGYIRDISQRVAAEKKRQELEAQLRQSQKLEAIGHLTGGVAHDFNNILTTIMGYVVMANERMEHIDDPKLNKYLDRINKAGHKARDLIQQMLTFSRGQKGEPRPLHLAPIISEAVKMLSSTLPSAVEIQLDIDKTLPRVMIDPVQLEQVLLNLCLNARDAVANNGEIAIRLHEVAGVGQRCSSCKKEVTGCFVALSVKDQGEGVSPGIIDRIFEPFYSTKEVGKGSGMGLAMVHGIVHEQGGHVHVKSTLGRGSQFTVLFEPLDECQENYEDKHSNKIAEVFHPLLSGRVLLVDDEEMVAEFMGDLLKEWGLSVVVRNQSLEALDIATQTTEHFDLMITDQTMPKLSGLELSKKVRKVHHDLPVILYTGYSDSITENDVSDAGISAFLRKPVDTELLYDTIKTLLNHSVTKH